MPRNYRTERDAIIERWYGNNPSSRNPKPQRAWSEDPITPADCLGVPIPVNAPYYLFGHCMVWKYTLNQDGYGMLRIDGKQELAHRTVYTQTRGAIPQDKQVNHLCDRPYCVQPSHLYAGTRQDNSDDSRIFRNHKLLNVPWVMHYPGKPRSGDPLIQRLWKSNRYEDFEPWEPAAQPPQMPLEEFTCPGHDFAITMFGGNSKVCRICDTSEFQEELFDSDGAWQIIAEICPASQMVPSILEKIAASEFVKDSHRDTRRRAYRRNQHGFGMGDHDLRNCKCPHCERTRREFREAIRFLLTAEESRTLDVCDLLEPQITAILEDASIRTMEGWAAPAELSEAEAQSLRDHYRECANSRTEMTRTARRLERTVACITHALTGFRQLEEITEDGAFQSLRLTLEFTRIREEHKNPTEEIILPIAIETTDWIVEKLEDEWAGLTMTGSMEKKDMDRFLKSFAWLNILKAIVEHLRYELTGENSATSQWPHPHQHCLQNIIEKGKVEGFPKEFQEGMGYSSQEGG